MWHSGCARRLLTPGEMAVGRFGPAQAGGEAVVFRELRQLASAQLRRGCRRSGFDWEAFIGDGPEWGVTEVIHRRAVQRGVVQRPDDVSADDVLAVVREVVSEWSNEPDLRPTYEGFCQEQARRGEKGRGTQRSQAALREAQVLELVAGGVTSHAEIGRRVGVHRCTVGRILARVAAARGANADATVVAPAEPVPFPAPEIPRWERWPVHQFMKQTGVMLDADDARWLAGMGRCYEAEGRVDDLMYAIGASAGSAVFNSWAYLQRCVSNRGDAWTASPRLLADVLVWAGEDSLRYALTTIASGNVRRPRAYLARTLQYAVASGACSARRPERPVALALSMCRQLAPSLSVIGAAEAVASEEQARRVGYVRRRQVPVDAAVPSNSVGAACCISLKGVPGDDYNYSADIERVLESSLSTVKADATSPGSQMDGGAGLSPRAWGNRAVSSRAGPGIAPC